MIYGGVLGLTLRGLQSTRSIMYHSILNVKPHGGPLPKWSALLDDIAALKAEASVWRTGNVYYLD